jgi:hypothetical protein
VPSAKKIKTYTTEIESTETTKPIKMRPEIQKSNTAFGKFSTLAHAQASVLWRRRQKRMEVFAEGAKLRATHVSKSEK